MSIRDLRNRSRSMIENLKKSQEESKSNASQEDKRFWRPTRDEAGNGSAIIRFIPQKDIEANPYVTVYSRATKNPKNNRWYIEEDRSTIGEDDPIRDYVSYWYSTGDEEDKNHAKKFNRKTQYISNIYVVSDPQHPENNGKVFLFKFGKSILTKINSLLTPEFEDEEPIAAFDYWDGCNFRLRIKMKDDYPNYDTSSFDAKAPLGDDDLIETVHESVYDLNEFLMPSRFKSYDELVQRFLSTFGEDAATRSLGWVMKNAKKATKTSTTEDDGDGVVEEKPKPSKKVEKVSAPAKKSEPDDGDDIPPQKTTPAKKTTPATNSADDGDDDDYYASLLASIG